MKKLGSLVYLLFDVAVAMIGYTIHHDILWSIVDFLFAPIALVYWLVTHQINTSVIHETFSFFLK